MTTHDDARAAWDAWITRPTPDEEYHDSLRYELDACHEDIEQLRAVVSVSAGNLEQAMAFLDAWLVATEGDDCLDLLRAETVAWMGGA